MTFVKTQTSKPRRNYKEQAEFKQNKRKGEDRKNLMRGRRADLIIMDDCCDE